MKGIECNLNGSDYLCMGPKWRAWHVLHDSLFIAAAGNPDSDSDYDVDDDTMHVI